jgi:hypothetical protein
VIIGMDPHKRSATIEIINQREKVLDQGGFGTDRDGYAAMLKLGLRNDTEGRAYCRRKLAAGKSPMEAIRCLKRRLSNVVYHQIIRDTGWAETGPGGQSGATLQSSAAGSIPIADTSDQPLPGPATTHSRSPFLAAS